MTANSRLLPTLSLLLAMLLWASSLVALKIAFVGYHPMLVIFGRMLIASLCFLPFLPGFFQLKWRLGDVKYLLLMAFCEPCCYFLFEAKALQLTSASQAGMVAATMPLVVAILAWLWLKEAIEGKTLLGFAVAISGAVWLSLASETSAAAPNPFLGNFCEFLAMVCAAGYTVSLKHLSSNYPPLLLTAVQAFFGSLFFFPFLLVSSGVPDHWEPLPALAIIYLGAFITFGAYTCFNYGVSRIPASHAAGYTNLIPVFGILLSMLILGERLNLQQWLACGLVFCGVWLSSRRRQRLVRSPAQA